MRTIRVIQAEVLLFSLEFILINLVVDVLYAALIRLSGTSKGDCSTGEDKGYQRDAGD